MKKLKLNLDDLRVESFETTPEQKKQQRGTVFGFITDTDGYSCEQCTVECGSEICGATHYVSCEECSGYTGCTAVCAGCE